MCICVCIYRERMENEVFIRERGASELREQVGRQEPRLAPCFALEVEIRLLGKLSLCCEGLRITGKAHPPDEDGLFYSKSSD